MKIMKKVLGYSEKKKNMGLQRYTSAIALFFFFFSNKVCSILRWFKNCLRFGYLLSLIVAQGLVYGATSETRTYK